MLLCSELTVGAHRLTALPVRAASQQSSTRKILIPLCELRSRPGVRDVRLPVVNNLRQIVRINLQLCRRLLAVQRPFLTTNTKPISRGGLPSHDVWNNHAKSALYFQFDLHSAKSDALLAPSICSANFHEMCGLSPYLQQMHANLCMPAQANAKGKAKKSSATAPSLKADLFEDSPAAAPGAASPEEARQLAEVALTDALIQPVMTAAPPSPHPHRSACSQRPVRAWAPVPA